MNPAKIVTGYITYVRIKQSSRRPSEKLIERQKKNSSLSLLILKSEKKTKISSGMAPSGYMIKHEFSNHRIYLSVEINTNKQTIIREKFPHYV